MITVVFSRCIWRITRGGLLALPLLVSGCGGGADAPAPRNASRYEVDDAAQRPLPSVRSSSATTDRNSPQASPADRTRLAESSARASNSFPIPSEASSAGKNGSTPAIKRGQKRPRASRVGLPQPHSGEQLNSEDIPETNPKNLQAFIEQVDLELARITDPRMSPEAVRSKVLPLLNSKLTAAERILALPSEESIREVALKAKLDVLTQLQFLTNDDLSATFQAFGEQLRKEKNRKFARQGKFVLLKLKIQRIKEKRETNLVAFVDEVKGLISEEESDLSLFEAVCASAMALDEIGRHSLSQEIMRTGATQFAKSKDPRMAIEGNIMLDHLSLKKNNFFDLANMVEAGRQGSMEELTKAVQTTLSERDASRYLLRNLAGVAAQFELAERYQQCRDIYAIMEESYQTHADPQVAEEGIRLAKNGKTRLNLLGKRFAVAGIRENGEPFDWTAYHQKVVLVAFWETTNAGCIEQIPQIKQAYSLYKDKGFTVVGVNLDEDTQRLNRFLVRNQLPWETVLSSDSTAQGYNSPMATRCGVDQLPFLVLVDRKGIAIALNTVGAKLQKKLQELLGPVGRRPPSEPTSKQQSRSNP